MKEKEAKGGNYVFPTTNLNRYRFPTHVNDLVMDRSEASFSEAFIVIIEPGKAPPLHCHQDTEQIFYVLEGSGVLTVGKDRPREVPVGIGDVIRIPVGEWHSIKADPDSVLNYLAIDCFGGLRSEDEPTWDAHVRVLCREQGWDYDRVKK
jgi:mannose-6-phosphate isomerase-like protein (cupin superfamily)